MTEQRVHSTRVTIFGETYPIKSQADPEYTQAVGEHVNRTMQLIRGKVGLQDAKKIAILAAMSVTDEYFQAREASDRVCEDFENRCNSLSDLIESSLEKHKAGRVLTG